jgi:hypothetical protein
MVIVVFIQMVENHAHNQNSWPEDCMQDVTVNDLPHEGGEVEDESEMAEILSRRAYRETREEDNDKEKEDEDIRELLGRQTGKFSRKESGEVL